MKTSDRGVDLIKQHEGLRLTAYPDAGYGWARGTIGYGHTSAAGSPEVTRGMRITAAEAEAILRRDLGKFERAVSSMVHVALTQAQFDALVSLAFNIGPGALEKSTLLRLLNRSDYQGAADQFERWNKSAGKVLSGLVKRRTAERTLFLDGSARPAPKPAAPNVRLSPNQPPARQTGFWAWLKSLFGG